MSPTTRPGCFEIPGYALAATLPKRARGAVQLTLSPLDVALADCLARRVHFPTLELVPGAVVCRVCAVVWETAAQWAADSDVCPGAKV